MQDEKLQGNDKIEAAIEALQKEPTQEMLAHALTVLRRRMKEDGELIVAVEPFPDSQIRLRAIRTADGSSWWAVFTSFEEEMKGADQVKSTFLGSMRQLFETALKTDEIKGIIVNPWNRTLMLDKALIRIVLGSQPDEA